MAICHHTISQQGANYDEKYMNVKLNTSTSITHSKEEEEDDEDDEDFFQILNIFNTKR